MNLSPEFLKEHIKIARQAGKEILSIYNSNDIDVEYKSDDSPITLADKKSHEYIKSELTKLSPDILIFSEEGKFIEYKDRKDRDSFYLVDPLDGTKEFIKRSGEFTVNIALIVQQKPVLGVIYVPVQDEMYYAIQGHGAFKQKGQSDPVKIQVNNSVTDQGFVVVESRSHGLEETEKYLNNFKIKDRVSRGSSLKFCLVAEGKAHIYPRLSPVWEWDAAAGHAIIAEAGGKVTDPEGNNLLYNKELPKHNAFVASGNCL